MLLLRRSLLSAATAALALLATACGGNPGGAAANSPAQPAGASSGAVSGSSTAGAAKGHITIGAANFAENEIIANMYAAVLQKAGFTTDVKTLSTREVIIPAMKTGDLDLEPDYAATLLEFVDGGKGLASPDVQATMAKLKANLPSSLKALDAASAIDTNGFAVRKETADKDHLSKLSDLKPYAPTMVLGGAPECPQRPFCLPGLEKVYGLHFKKFVPLDAGGPLTHQALKQGKIDVGEIFTTDANLQGFVLLADDRHLQNADNVVPIVNAKADSPQLDQAVNAVQAKLTTEVLQQLNGQVINNHKDPADVAKAWLTQEGLL